MFGILSLVMVVMVAEDLNAESSWREYSLLAISSWGIITYGRSSYRDFRLPLMRVVEGKFEWRDPEGTDYQEFALEEVASCGMENGIDLRIGLRSGEEVAISLKPVDEEVRPSIIAALKNAASGGSQAADPA
ncbi:MAG: hypothetical protein JKY61_07775 [Planctomycetes bacterium]|nr:hypothetical protein [Planctomycetota bacterium]